MLNTTHSKLQSHHTSVRPRVESGMKREPYYCNFGVRFKATPKKGKQKMPIQPPVDQETANTLFGATGALAYLIVIGVAILGGIAKFIKELNESIHTLPLKHMFFKLCGNIFIAIFAGMISFWFAIIWSFSDPSKAIMIALSGYLGGNAINGFIGIYNIWIKSQQRHN